jgi:hypothetical protein
LRRRIMNRIGLALFLTLAFGMGWGCYYYAPPPYVVTYPPRVSYDQIWDSALRAAQDVGIRITSSEKGAGTVVGHRDGVGVTIQVTPYSEGRTRVELTAKGDPSATSAVSEDFYRRYEQYMGRR